MKKIFSVFVFLLFIVTIVSSAFSYSVDGIDTGLEWDGAAVYKLVDGNSNSDVNFGLVKIKFDYENRAVCFCFQFSDPYLTKDNSQAGISFCVDDSSVFKIVASDGYSSLNIDNYSFEGAVSLDENNGATCEIIVGIKSGLPKEINALVQFIDSNGAYSNEYRFVVVNENYIPETELVMYPTSDNEDSDYEYYSNNVKSSKSNTYKSTTYHKRTRVSTTREEIIIKTSPPYSYTGRVFTKKPKTESTIETTAKLTTPKTTKQKTTKQKSTKKSSDKVYYYEKEIYISEVYVSYPDSNQTSEMQTTVLQSEETVINETSENKNTLSLSQGTKYKKIVTVAAVIAFSGVACYGVISAKNKKSPE